MDNIHGDICPSSLEWKVIDTPSFQRLRKLKQLQMGYLVYPNATHTRFVHSIGVLHIMQKILRQARVRVKPDEAENLCLAALMHDIGHYPYSHLLEGVDDVILTEERLTPTAGTIITEEIRYPNHEEVGREILLHQSDLRDLLGADRAKDVGNIFSRATVADQELSKLIHSSLDMDRLDYLIRDSEAAGVPYGKVDIHYLLNHVRLSKTGAIGITHKALAAAEHLLLARSFLYRVVCQHKTTFGFEETARQLLRRLRNRGRAGGESYGVPVDGKAVMNIIRDKRELGKFTDAFLDDVFVQAAEDGDDLIKLLATCIITRRPPRLVWQKQIFKKRAEEGSDGELLLERCRNRLQEIAKKYDFRVEQFLICVLPKIGFESRGPQIPATEAKKHLEGLARETMIKVFPTEEDDEPVDIVSLPYSLLHEIGSHIFRSYRLYIVCADDAQEEKAKAVKEELKVLWK